MDAKTAAALASFVSTAQSVVDAYYRQSCPNLTPSKLTVDPGGKRYVRIVTTTDGGQGQRSAYCFVDITNGNILKSATWKAPAKHARGSIFAVDNGRSAIGPHGANYLG